MLYSDRLPPLKEMIEWNSESDYQYTFLNLINYLLISTECSPEAYENKSKALVFSCINFAQRHSYYLTRGIVPYYLEDKQLHLTSSSVSTILGKQRSRGITKSRRKK